MRRARSCCRPSTRGAVRVRSGRWPTRELFRKPPHVRLRLRGLAFRQHRLGQNQRRLGQTWLHRQGLPRELNGIVRLARGKRQARHLHPRGVDAGIQLQRLEVCRDGVVHSCRAPRPLARPYCADTERGVALTASSAVARARSYLLSSRNRFARATSASTLVGCLSRTSLTSFCAAAVSPRLTAVDDNRSVAAENSGRRSWPVPAAASSPRRNSRWKSSSPQGQSNRCSDRIRQRPFSDTVQRRRRDSSPGRTWPARGSPRCPVDCRRAPPWSRVRPPPDVPPSSRSWPAPAAPGPTSIGVGGFLERGFGLIAIPPRQLERGEAGVAGAAVGTGANRAFDLGDGGVEVLEAGERGAPGNPCVDVLRRRRERPFGAGLRVQELTAEQQIIRGLDLDVRVAGQEVGRAHVFSAGTCTSPTCSYTARELQPRFTKHLIPLNGVAGYSMIASRYFFCARYQSPPRTYSRLVTSGSLRHPAVTATQHNITTATATFSRSGHVNLSRSRVTRGSPKPTISCRAGAEPRRDVSCKEACHAASSSLRVGACFPEGGRSSLPGHWRTKGLAGAASTTTSSADRSMPHMPRSYLSAPGAN